MNSDSYEPKASQALVEVRDDIYYPSPLEMKAKIESSLDESLYIPPQLNSASSLVPSTGFLPPPQTTKHHFSLEEAYLAYDLRESYL